MTYEELMEKLGVKEAAFRYRVREHLVGYADGHYESVRGTCIQCPHWSKDDGGHCTNPITEKHCRANFEEWLKMEVE